MRKKSKGDTWDGIFFADPEVGRVLHTNGLIADANKSSIEELATITSLSTYFRSNKIITKFPELQYCTGLTNLNTTFAACSNLTEITIPEGVTNMYSTFYNCSSLVDAPIIPASVTNMYDTFDGCSSLVEAPIIPESVTNMGETFWGCSSLVNAPIIPASVTNMGETFYYCTNLDGIFIIKPVTPPAYNGTFRSVNVVAIYVPDESVSIYKSRTGWRDHSSKIKPMSQLPIYFADPEVGRVLHANGLIANANKTSKSELASITSLNPSGIVNGSYFFRNKVITKFPELKYCTGLSDIGLFRAFNNCSNLIEVGEIPEGVTDMNGTFFNCTSLNGIFIIKPVTPPAYNGTFYKANVVAIYVPDESVSSYKTASGWIAHSSIIYPISSLPE